MKYYLIAGEASGDLHASNLMRSLKEEDQDAEFRYWGGDLMMAEGGTLVKHINDLAYMGIIEVILHLRTIKENFKICRKDIIDNNPDVIVLIDYSGFNLRIAKYAKENGFKVFYYISPKVWVWKKSRIITIKRYVDRMFTILPFETDFYAVNGYKVDYVGNPLMDAIEKKKEFLKSRASFISENELSTKDFVALLPGSRKQEIKRLLPIMTRLSDEFPDYQFLIAGVSSLEKAYYQKYKPYTNIIFL